MYTKWLIPLSVAGVITFLICWLADDGDPSTLDLNHDVTIFYGFFICFWGTLFLEAWKRQQASLAYK